MFNLGHFTWTPFWTTKNSVKKGGLNWVKVMSFSPKFSRKMFNFDSKCSFFTKNAPKRHYFRPKCSKCILFIHFPKKKITLRAISHWFVSNVKGYLGHFALLDDFFSFNFHLGQNLLLKTKNVVSERNFEILPLVTAICGFYPNIGHF